LSFIGTHRNSQISKTLDANIDRFSKIKVQEFRSYREIATNFLAAASTSFTCFVSKISITAAAIIKRSESNVAVHIAGFEVWKLVAILLEDFHQFLKILWDY
jgi:hypothetical protein